MEQYSSKLLIDVLKKNIILIIFAALLLGAAAFAFSYYIIDPKYTATASLYVHSNPDSSEITSYEITASQQLVSTYIVILKSDTVLDRVISNLSLTLTAKELRKSLEATALDDTEAFSISFTHADPKVAQEVINMIVRIAPEEIIRIVKAGGVEVIDYAKLPLMPSSPNIILNTLIGVCAGFFLTLGFCLLKKMYDTKIREEKDLSRFNIPVVGIIPIILNK